MLVYASGARRLSWRTLPRVGQPLTLDVYGAPVPDDPALIGADIYWQALQGSPLRLTNLERTGLTGF